jgi:hypothetical protein
MFPGWPSGSEEDLSGKVLFTSSSLLVVVEDPRMGIDGPGIGVKVSGKARYASGGNHVGDMFR